MILFEHNIQDIFILLGNDCNFKCKYCFVRTYKPQKSKQYNKKIIDFIKQTADNQETLTVSFFGGEPLLYFDIIKSIIFDLKSCTNIKYRICTNGSLIDKECLDFINTNDISISLSWDGRNSELSRGVDVMKTNRDNLLTIDKLSLLVMINKYTNLNNVLDDIEDLERIRGFDINVIISNIRNVNNVSDEIFDFDISKIITDNSIYRTKNKFTEDLNKRLMYYEENRDTILINGYSVLSIDLIGNLYIHKRTHDKPIGNIETSLYSDYMMNWNYFDKLYKDYYYKKCYCCNVKALCNKESRNIYTSFVDKSFCKKQKLLYTPFIK